MTVFMKPVVFRDEIKIGDNTLRVEFKPEDIAPQYFSLVRELANAEKRIKDNPHEYSEKFIALMVLVYGKDNAKSILDYYHGEMAAMLAETTKYIGLRVAPVMRAASRIYKSKLKQEKKARRKLSQKRWFK